MIDLWPSVSIHLKVMQVQGYWYDSDILLKHGPTVFIRETLFKANNKKILSPKHVAFQTTICNDRQCFSFLKNRRNI